MQIRQILLIRHCEVPDEYRGRYIGSTDVPLSEAGRAAARNLAPQLARFAPETVLSSPLRRAAETAELAAPGREIRFDSRLAEIDFGEWEMKTWDEIQADPRSAAWWDDWIDTPAPRGESFRQQYARLADFLQDIQRRSYRRVCLFAHGGILSAARIYTGEIPFGEAFRQVLPYGTVLRIEI